MVGQSKVLLESVPESLLVKVQAASGLVFSSFLSLHLLNTITANMGDLAYDGFMEMLRLYYQNPIVEYGILGSALLIHMASSFIRYFRRQQRVQNNKEESKTAESSESLAPSDVVFSIGSTHVTPRKLHQAAGLVLSNFVLAHIFFTRGPAFFGEPAANFFLITNSLLAWPACFYPYYALLGFSGLYHMSYGVVQAAKVFRAKVPSAVLPRRKPFWIFIGITTIGIVSGILAFGGVYFPLPVEKTFPFRPFYEKVFPQSLHGLLLPWKNSDSWIGRLSFL